VPSLVVDPVLCTTPELAAEAGEVRGWLEALEDWLGAQQESAFMWRHFLPCTRRLEELGRFPTFEALRRLQGAAPHINAVGLLRRIARFFQNEAHDLRRITASQEVAVIEDEATVLPPAILDRNLPEIRGPLVDGLLCLACDKTAGEPFAGEAHFVTMPFVPLAEEVTVAGTVGMVEPEHMTERLRSLELDQRFPVLISPGDLSRFHYEALLAGGEAGYCELIAEVAESRHPGLARIAASVGGQFWQSLHRSGIIEDRFAALKLLVICAATLAGRLDELNVDRRPKRKTEAANSPPQVRDRDKAKAWRLTVTKAGAGYRLHYWHVPARDQQIEQIEFANVLRETDPVVIPEG
jgi:hypothetical protein